MSQAREAVEGLINDVTGLNPERPSMICRPRSEAELIHALKNSKGPVTIAGGRFSMGGHVAQDGALMLDMSGMDQVISVSAAEKRVRVQAGATWRSIQEKIDPMGLSVSVMQTYSNFTVGGSLSVNCHGRYMGKGPISLTVKSIRAATAQGEVFECSPNQREQDFWAIIGGMGACAIILEAELELEENVRVRRESKRMSLKEYRDHFLMRVRSAPDAVFHNADLYPPHYSKVNAVTWRKTEEPLTDERKFQPKGVSRWLEKYFFWSISEAPFGKTRRQIYIDPILFAKKIVRTRNCEASYDVEELEPASREKSTYVLQEYFIPIEKALDFVEDLRETLNRHEVNMINISLRHAFADPSPIMAWARSETAAFVLYYKQGVQELDKEKVGAWTRELTKAAIDKGGCYYLPYQPHHTTEQFKAAYPRWQELFEKKRELDPSFRLQGALWRKHYEPWIARKEGRSARAWIAPESVPQTLESETDNEREEGLAQSSFDAKTIYERPELADRFFLFLSNVFRTLPEHEFHAWLRSMAKSSSTREEFFRGAALAPKEMGGLKAALTLALPALFKQKRVIREQMSKALEEIQKTHPEAKWGRHLEIGARGRHASDLRAMKGGGFESAVFLAEKPASMMDWIERKGAPMGDASMIGDWSPRSLDFIEKESLDSASALIGLHHIPPQRLQAFCEELTSKIKPGGLLILREHDVKNEEIRLMAAMAHEVFGAALGDPWEAIRDEVRNFKSCQEWSKLLASMGWVDSGLRIAQKGDPTDNLLMAFRKSAS